MIKDLGFKVASLGPNGPNLRLNPRGTEVSGEMEALPKLSTVWC